MDQRYRETTLSVEDQHWWYVGRRRVVRIQLERRCRGKPLDILDAGCGGGGNLSMLAEFGSVTGLEPSPEAAAQAAARGVGTVVIGTVEHLRFEDGSFDLAVSMDVLEHVVGEQEALAELLRVVVDGGLLLLTVPAYRWLWGPHDIWNEHQRRYTARSLSAAAGAAGWKRVYISYFNMLMLPIAVPHRLFDSVRYADASPPRSDFERTPERWNRALGIPLRWEAQMMGAGIRLPAGLSILAVFEKPSARM